jgi:tRNA1Val (adenine37-N6)-methyltransferase
MSSIGLPSFEQSKLGYRHSAEPLLLADFVDLKPGDHILDIGTGCGIIPILLLHRVPGINVTAIEIQESLIAMAQKNIFRRGFTKEIKLIHGDFRIEKNKMFQESLDVVTSNPPYGKLNQGKINPMHEKAIARHELKLNLKSLVTGSAKLLKPGGKIYLAYPPVRFEEVKNELMVQGLSPSRYFFANGRNKSQPQFFIMEAIKSQITNCVRLEPKQI